MGTGVDGTVWLARATPNEPGKPNLIVAVKVTKPTKKARTHLREEWIIGRRLGVWPECHTMFPCMLELGPDGTWFSREYVEGVTVKAAIRAWARAGRPTLYANLRELLGDLARAQRTAHEQGVVHHDGHTENMIWRPDGSLTLIDFGKSCLLVPDARGPIRCDPTDKADDIIDSLGWIEDEVRDRVSFRSLPPDLRDAFDADSIEELMATLGPARVPSRAAAYAMDPHQMGGT